jgi:hypothetical protein
MFQVTQIAKDHSHATELGIGQPPGSLMSFTNQRLPAKLEADFKTTEFSFSGHKTTEQTQVLSQSDVYSAYAAVTVPKPDQLPSKVVTPGPNSRVELSS